MLQRQVVSMSMLMLLMALAFMQAMHAAHGALPRAGDPGRTLCAREIRHQERTHNIPQHLLAAIALAESGRWDASRKESFAWPWTVMAEGKGRFLPSKAEAVATVRRLQAEGVRNIDVGCMQINLRYHPDAFASLDQAFDPAANAAYAATFLAALFRETGSWERAVARYHSATPEHAIPYRERVMTLWARVRNDPPAFDPPAPPATTVATSPPDLAAPIDHERMARISAARTAAAPRQRSILTAGGASGSVVRRDADHAALFAENRRRQLQEWRSLVKRLKSATTMAAAP